MRLVLLSLLVVSCGEAPTSRQDTALAQAPAVPAMCETYSADGLQEVRATAMEHFAQTYRAAHGREPPSVWSDAATEQQLSNEASHYLGAWKSCWEGAVRDALVMGAVPAGAIAIAETECEASRSLARTFHRRATDAARVGSRPYENEDAAYLENEIRRTQRRAEALTLCARAGHLE